jgi:hypothetical protein
MIQKSITTPRKWRICQSQINIAHNYITTCKVLLNTEFNTVHIVC